MSNVPSDSDLQHLLPGAGRHRGDRRAPGYQTLASSSSTAASPIDVVRGETVVRLARLTVSHPLASSQRSPAVAWRADGAVPDGTTVFADEIRV